MTLRLFALMVIVLGAACGDDSATDAALDDASQPDAPAADSGPDARAPDAGSDADVPSDAPPLDTPPSDAPDAGPETARRLLDWNDGTGVRIEDPVGESLDGYVRGGDFDRAIWASDSIWSWYLLHVTEGGVPTTDFARATLPQVMDRNGELATVLKMALLRDAPGTTVEQIEFLQQQSMGRAGDTDSSFPDHTLVEPVFYQRQWIKFSPETRVRAEGIGERDFYQIFWEMKAYPDYRLRVQLVYRDALGLVVQAHDDVMGNADPLYVDSGAVAVGTIEMAEEDASNGWHLFEVWLDRTRGNASRWRVRFNSVDVLDYTGPLEGDSGNIINVAMMGQIYSDVTDLSTSPFFQLVDDVEVWDSPPRDAFTL